MEELGNLMEGYCFNRVIYWKMNKTHKITIKRDREWFTTNLPRLEKFWKDVQYYKEHKEELPKYLEDLRKDEPKLNKNNNFMATFGLPPMYKKLTASMDLTCNPYLNYYVDNCSHCIKYKSKKNISIQTPQHTPVEIKKPVPKKTYMKNSVFIKNPGQKAKYEPQDDFLSDT